jgi:hypothetical protein
MKSGHRSIYLLVVLATLGAWWHLPSFHELLHRLSVQGTGTFAFALALALCAGLVVLWTLFIRRVATSLLAGPGARAHAFIATGTGAVLFALLMAYDVRMSVVAERPAELIARMDSDAVTTSIPDPDRLGTRVQEFYAALGSKDVRKMHDMSRAPVERDRQLLREYRKKYGLNGKWSRQPPSKMTVTVAQVCHCVPWTWRDGTKSLRCVLLMTGVKEGPAPPRKTTMFLDTWEHMHGEWYPDCPGPQSDGCPSDPYAGYCRTSYHLDDL